MFSIIKIEKQKKMLACTHTRAIVPLHAFAKKIRILKKENDDCALFKTGACTMRPLLKDSERKREREKNAIFKLNTFLKIKYIYLLSTNRPILFLSNPR